MKTDVTHGTVVEFCHEDKTLSPPRVVFELIIAVTTGDEYEEIFKIRSDEPLSIPDILSAYTGESVSATVVDAGARKIRFKGTVCSLPGDSGSVWLDDARHPCGLLYAGKGLTLAVEGEKQPVFVPSGKSVACFIRPVLLALNLDPANAIAVASSPSSGPVVVTPGDELVTVARTPEYLAELEATLRWTTAGEHLLVIFREHHREFLDLVNRRRRVTAVWHRSKGPAFVAAFLNMARSGGQTIPNNVSGHSLENLISNMLDVLSREGSHAVKLAVERDGDFLLRLARECETLDDVSQLRVTEDLRRVAS